ncbi:MAG: hypothetical protein M3Q22_03350 [Actinomycetota bacterium]|nr:hypothetical protein [Actinomycetota bacterium]
MEEEPTLARARPAADLRHGVERPGETGVALLVDAAVAERPDELVE